MAVDTTAKKLAVLSLGKPGFTLPLGDGSFDSADKHHFLGLYGGFAEAVVSHAAYGVLEVVPRAEGVLFVSSRGLGDLTFKTRPRAEGVLSVEARAFGLLKVLPRGEGRFGVNPN